MQYPTIADLDGDGSAEVLIVTAGVESSASSGDPLTGFNGLTVFTSPSGSWGPAGPVWPSYDFNGVNINPDLTVPRNPVPGYQTLHSLHARPYADEPGADLTIEITDWCSDGCEGEDLVRVALQISNHGHYTSVADIPVSLYAEDPDTGPRLLLSTRIAPRIKGGMAGEGFAVEIPLSEIGDDPIYAVVDDFGDGRWIQEECDEVNNESARVTVTCTP